MERGRGVEEIEVERERREGEREWKEEIEVERERGERGRKRKEVSEGEEVRKGKEEEGWRL